MTEPKDEDCRLRAKWPAMTDTTKHMLRAMAWERAKGELRSILVTYQNEKASFSAMEIAVQEFINRVENNGWAE